MITPTFQTMSRNVRAFVEMGSANQLRLWAMSQHGVTNAKQLGFSVIRFRDTVNISDIIYDSWEERTSISFSVGVVRILSVDSEYYDSLCIDILQGTTEVPTIILEVE